MLLTRHGQVGAISLADGSKLILDADSAVSVSLGSTARILSLTKGRARFAAAHDAARPFIVETKAGSVTTTGTMFDVGLQEDGVEIVLLRGAIDIHPAGVHDRAVVHAQTAGQRIYLGADTFSSTSAAEQLPRWPSGMLDFDQTPLASAVAEINRYNRVQITLRGVPGHRLTGGFHARDPQSFARAVAVMFHLRRSSDGKGNIILSM